MFQKAKTTNKLTALLLVLVMLLSLVPGMSLTAYANGGSIDAFDGQSQTISSDQTCTRFSVFDGSTLTVNQGVTLTLNISNGHDFLLFDNSTMQLHGTLTGSVASDARWMGNSYINVYLSDGAKYTVTGLTCMDGDNHLRYYGYDAATDGNGTVSVTSGSTAVTASSIGYKTTTYTFTATPASGYKFKNWTKGAGGEVLGTDASINVTCEQNGQYQVYANFEVAHTHSFTYSASGATITASCGEGCDITTGLTLSISAPTGDLVADGTKTFPATLSTGYNTTAFPGTYNIAYTKDGQPYNGTPTEAGAYVASVTVGDATASVSYTITDPDQLAADAVVALIDAIGTVEYTDACKDKIDAARAAYDALTADQQALVNNYSTLTEAKTEYDELKGDADIALANLLRIRNATASVNGTTITLTPEDETATASMVCKLWDRTDVEFSNLDGATISKGGSLYADKYATATATIGGVEYTVVFNYEVIEFVLTPDLLKITNAEAAVDGTTITLTPVDESKQVNLYPKLKDGSEVVFSGISGLATTSKAGTLYAKGVASAKATINGTEYTVVFNYTPPAVEELIQVTGADVSVEGTTITLTATSGKVCFYSSLKDGSKATYSKSTITNGLGVTATVSKYGTIYAKGDASAIVTIGGVEYTVNFVF